MDGNLLQMAREAGIVDNDCGWPESKEYGMVTWNELARFAELVRADERERMHAIAEKEASSSPGGGPCKTCDVSHFCDFADPDSTDCSAKYRLDTE